MNAHPGSINRDAVEQLSRKYEIGQFLYFDIETIPDQRPEAIQKCRELVKPPASMKKQETIDKWWKEQSESAAQEMLSKTSLDGGRGHICTIGWARNNGDIRVEHAETINEETNVLREFFKEFQHGETLVGHNIVGFDIPFIIKRAIILGIDLPADYQLPRDPKPWSTDVFDTMRAWAGQRDMISMDALCGVLGVFGKDDFDGSKVAGAWIKGDHEAIAQLLP